MILYAIPVGAWLLAIWIVLSFLRAAGRKSPDA